MTKDDATNLLAKMELLPAEQIELAAHIMSERSIPDCRLFVKLFGKESMTNLAFAGLEEAIDDLRDMLEKRKEDRNG